MDAPAGFDTFVSIGVLPGKSADDPIAGFALAFGGHAHRCFAWAFTTVARGPGAAAVVGERLATMVERSLGKVVLESELVPHIPRDRPKPGRWTGPTGAWCQRVPSGPARAVMDHARPPRDPADFLTVRPLLGHSPTMKLLTLLSAGAVLFACGCEAEPAPVPRRARASSAADAAIDAEVTRDVAVRTARADASTRFRELGGFSFVNAQPFGRFWVVELHASNGQGLRYAIAKSDGTIRQRSLVR